MKEDEIQPATEPDRQPHLPAPEAEAHEGPQAKQASLPSEPAGPASTSQALDARIVKLEERTDIEFIRREARLIPSLMNFWQHFRWRNPRSDPRSRAALGAVLWRIFSPGAAAAAGGGALLLLQTWLLFQQNDKLDQQTHVMQSQANIAVASQIGPVLDKLMEVTEEACIQSPIKRENVQQSETQETLIEVPRCWVDVRPDLRREWRVGCVADETCTVRSAVVSSIKGPGGGYEQDWTLPLPVKLQSQIVALTLLSRPYRFVDTAHLNVIGNPGEPIREQTVPTLVGRPLSPERGLMLISLITSGAAPGTSPLASADFTAAYAYRANLADARIGSLEFTSFPLARMTGVTAYGAWTGADFRCAAFDLADLGAVSIHRGDYSGATFTNATLPFAGFSPSLLHSTNFDGAIVTEADFLARLAELKIPGFSADHWRIEDEDGKHTIRRVEGTALASIEC